MDPVMGVGIVVFAILFVVILGISAVALAGLRSHRWKRTTLPVTVLVPVYNGQDDLEACVRAILTQTHPCKVIIIDDGSTDGTRSIAALLAKDRRVTYLRVPHRGKVAALNAGLRKVRTPLVMTLDADTVVTEGFLTRMLAPFSDKTVGATSGEVLPDSQKGVLGALQSVEYPYNNLVRRGFSTVFGNGIWFFGCVGAYRTALVRTLGGFPADTLTEDMDLALIIKKAGFRTIDAHDAVARTRIPTSILGIVRQRLRWWTGGFQCLRKHHAMLRPRYGAEVLILFLTQYWWAVYAFVGIPLLAYQFWYWWPDAGTFAYTARWLTAAGPIYVLWKIPQWGVNVLNIFGVLTGILSTAMLVTAVSASGRPTWRQVLAIICYFPYTLLLNAVVAASAIRAAIFKKRAFVAEHTQ